MVDDNFTGVVIKNIFEWWTLQPRWFSSQNIHGPFVAFELQNEWSKTFNTKHDLKKLMPLKYYLNI